MNDSTTTTTETTEPRQADGRFAKGNRCGVGNPFARQTARLRQAALDAVSPEDIHDIIDAMKRKAAEGDVPAAKLLLSYCIGKPTVPENPDTLDQQEFKNMVNNTVESAEGPVNIIKGMPLDLMIEILRIVIPSMRSDKMQMARSVLCAPLTEEEIEANEEDKCQDDDTDDDSAPAGDPFQNIPDWMKEIGKEPEEAEPKPKGKRKERAATKPARPAEPKVDGEALRVLLERARDLAASSEPGENGTHDSEAANAFDELLKTVKRGKSPSANGSNGKR